MNPRFVFIADTHHFSRTLSDGGEAYAYRSGSDQKCLEETGEIIDAAFEKILENPPDAVMIAGDLSDDGERVCHEEFREKLRELQKHVPVYVITATHDWCCDENPRRFTNAEVTNDVETVSHEELSDFYREFAEALSQADEVLLLPIYPAREEPIEGIASEIIAERVTVPCRIVGREALAATLGAAATDVVVSFGAGNIDACCDAVADVLRKKA